MVGKFFAADTAATHKGVRIPVDNPRRQASWLTPRGRLGLEPGVQIREIRLSVRDMPENKAAGPDLFLAEMHINCHSMHRWVQLYTRKTEELLYCTPRQSGGRSSTMRELLQMVLVRRIMTYVDEGISCSRYAN